MKKIARYYKISTVTRNHSSYAAEYNHLDTIEHEHERTCAQQYLDISYILQHKESDSKDVVCLFCNISHFLHFSHIFRHHKT